MENSENIWDKRLQIRTAGRDDTGADSWHHPYEPTPYCVLERLGDSGLIRREDVVVDYGCGKGRVGFFLNHVLGCRTIGLEYDERIFLQAVQNNAAYDTARPERCVERPKGGIACDKERAGKTPVTFLCQNAADYEPTSADCFYFFNPFSVEILRSVLARILDSYYDEPRTMRLFFYYPDDEYVAYLMAGGTGAEMLDFVDEIACQDLFRGKDKRERILIFEIGELDYEDVF